MSTQKVQIDDLANAVVKAMEEYSTESTRILKEETEKAAKECANEINQNAKGSFGGSKYSKSWKAKKTYDGREDVRFSVYSTVYQLAHLLEYGHRKFIFGHDTGGRVAGRAHIRPAADKIADSLVDKIKVRLGGS